MRSSPQPHGCHVDIKDARRSASQRLLCRVSTMPTQFYETLHIVTVRRSSIRTLNTLWTGDADLCLCITTVEDGWRTSAFLTRAWFHALYTIITQYMQPFSEWSYWRMFIETWPHSEVMICDKYREQTALYVPLLLCTAFSQFSDFNHFTPMTERGSSYEEKYLTED